MFRAPIPTGQTRPAPRLARPPRPAAAAPPTSSVAWASFTATVRTRASRMRTTANARAKAIPQTTVVRKTTHGPGWLKRIPPAAAITRANKMNPTFTSRTIDLLCNSVMDCINASCRCELRTALTVAAWKAVSSRERKRAVSANWHGCRATTLRCAGSRSTYLPVNLSAGSARTVASSAKFRCETVLVTCCQSTFLAS